MMMRGWGLRVCSFVQFSFIKMGYVEMIFGVAYFLFLTVCYSNDNNKTLKYVSFTFSKLNLQPYVYSFDFTGMGYATNPSPNMDVLGQIL